jgi:hypothetical protein
MDPALEALRAALEEYLAQGGDTPVAAEAQALMQAIDGGAAEGGMPPEEGMMPPEGGLAGLGEEMPPEEGMPPMEEEMPPAQPDAKTFDEANAGATERLKKLNRR